jgi:hypothetical protein
LSSEIAALEQARAQDRPEDKPMRMTGCKFSADELAELQALWRSPLFTKSNVERSRQSTSEDFQPPPAVGLRALQAIPVPCRRQPRPIPEWVRCAAWNREFFSTSCVKLESDEGSSFWKFVYAKQSPIVVTMAQLTPLEVPVPLLQGVPACEMGFRVWDHVFEIDWGRCEFSDDGPWHEDARCWVLPNAMHWEVRLVVADGDWLPIAAVQAFLPRVPVAEARDKESGDPVAPSFEDNIYSANPWLADYLKWGRQDRHSSGKASTATTPRAGGGLDDMETELFGEEGEAELVFEELLRRRSELGLSGPAKTANFHVVLRDGPWLFHHTGKACDSVRGEAASPDAAGWCEAAGMQKSFTASLAAYGESVALLLCRAWVAKMEYLYDLACVEGPGFAFTPAALSDFNEDPEVELCFHGGDQAVRRRIAQVRDMKPRG